MSEVIKRTVAKASVKKALRYMKNDPERNLPKLVKWADRVDKGGEFKRHIAPFRNAIEDKDSNWHKLLVSLWEDVDDGVRMNLFENFIVHACFEGLPMQHGNEEKYHCNIPWAILMDPTSACNLKCTGCWAAEYGDKLNMSIEMMDYIIRQGKSLGTYMYIFSGGEPLIKKNDIIRICEKHSDCVFLAFTNGTLIDEEFAEEMLRVKNFIPAISIEGYEEETDFRRGKGTFKKVMEAMEILRRKKLAFGASCCYTSKNVATVGSGGYLDFLIAKGAKFAWFFTYMPIGNKADVSLMATAKQREFMYHQIRDFRKTKPLFTMDFWNDGEYVGGCIAGGRKYLHINANGDVEPCAFVHYSDSNIHQKSLLQAYKSPLFMQYYDKQPFNDNMLRPCPILDNYGVLAEMVVGSGALSTDLESPEDADAYCDKCKHAAEEWAPVAERLWRTSIVRKMEEEEVVL